MSCSSGIVRTCWRNVFLYNLEIIITHICVQEIAEIRAKNSMWGRQQNANKSLNQ